MARRFRASALGRGRTAATEDSDSDRSVASDTSDLFEAQENQALEMNRQIMRAATIALHCKQYDSHSRLQVCAAD